MTIRQAKRAMRQEIVAKIAGLSLTERSRQQAALDELFPSLPGYVLGKTVLLYVSIFPEEVETRVMMQHALDSGKRVLCPRVERTARKLRLFSVSDPERDLRTGTLGIPEPSESTSEVEPLEVDWVLMPGLAFDARGYRLGRGGGYYDRLLPSLRLDTPRWALAFDSQWVESVPVEPHDQRLTGIVTPGSQCDPRFGQK